MKDNKVHCISDYATMSDLYGSLPRYWIKCGKNLQELRNHIASEYEIKNEKIIDDIVSETLGTYEQEFSRQQLGDWKVTDYYEETYTEEEVIDMVLDDYFRDEEVNQVNATDYVKESDLHGSLPLYWIECGKNLQKLKSHIYFKYAIKSQKIIDKIALETLDEYEEARFFHHVDDWKLSDHYHECFTEEEVMDMEFSDYFADQEWFYKEGEAYENRQSGLLFRVREVDGEYVINEVGCLSVIGVAMFLIFLYNTYF